MPIKRHMLLCELGLITVRVGGSHVGYTNPELLGVVSYLSTIITARN